MANRNLRSEEHPFSENSYSIDTNGRCSVEELRDRVMERHLSGEMSPAEDAAFIEHLLDCTACNRELQFREALRDELRKEPLDQVLSDNIRCLNLVEKPQSYFRYYVAAAIALLCFLSWFYLVGISGEQHWGELAILQIDEEKPLILQGADEELVETYNTSLQALISAQPRFSVFSSDRYNSSELANAIEGFEALFDQELSADIRSDIGFYLFKSYLLRNDARLAIRWLSEAATVGENNLKKQRYKRYVDGMLLQLEMEGSRAFRMNEAEKQRLIDSLKKLKLDLADGANQLK